MLLFATSIFLHNWDGVGLGIADVPCSCTPAWFHTTCRFLVLAQGAKWQNWELLEKKKVSISILNFCWCEMKQPFCSKIPMLLSNWSVYKRWLSFQSGSMSPPRATLQPESRRFCLRFAASPGVGSQQEDLRLFLTCFEWSNCSVHFCKYDTAIPLR